MLSPSLISTVFSQIESLVYFRNKKNHKSNHSEINQIIKLYASEAERHFIRCLFSSIDCSNETKSQKDLHQVQYFSQELSKLLTKFNFVSLICYSIEKPLLTHKNDISPIRLFSQITQISTLNRLQEVILGLSLTHTNDAQLNTSAKHWVHQKLSDFIQAHLAVDNVQTANTCGSSTSAGGSVQLSNIIDGQTTSTLSSKPLQDSSNTYSLHEISTELLHFILSHLFEDSEHYGLSDSVMTNFIYSLRTDYPRGCSSMLLNTFLYPDIVGHPMIIKHIKLVSVWVNLSRVFLVLNQIL
ncbi:unnamed protein product [Heterobilharzia americana]|nr:unnamed protein product [Heterobilharzia americana]